MREMLAVVQFIHPGGEHGEDERGLKYWNQGAHRRKFVVTPGRCATTDGGEEDVSDLAFWAEWEPPSTTERLSPGGAGLPRFVHRPAAIPVPLPPRRQNTDPWVFSDPFRFTLCQQVTKHGPTQLRFLRRGSVILFGSYVGGAFALDTCFVVGGFDDVTPRSFSSLEASLDATYVAATFALLEPHIQAGGSLRLYHGATPGQPVEGMFSFFPAQQLSSQPNGFARPIVTLSDVVTSHLTQGRRQTTVATTSDAAAVWRRVVAQVEEPGLRLGTSASVPQLSELPPVAARPAGAASC
jgi:hypothetical protein